MGGKKKTHTIYVNILQSFVYQVEVEHKGSVYKK